MEEENAGNGKIGNYLITDILDGVGKNGCRYLGKFQRLNEKRQSFNWCAALFSCSWFAYRKMWKEALLSSGINLVYTEINILIRLSLPESFWTDFGFMICSLFISLLFMIAYGFLGDRLYFKKVRTILDKQGCTDKTGVRDEEWEASLRKAGGTSAMGVAVLLVLFFIIQLCRNVYLDL